MVEHGGQIQQNAGAGKDRYADDICGCPLFDRVQDQIRRTHERAGQTDAMTDTVGDFFLF